MKSNKPEEELFVIPVPNGNDDLRFYLYSPLRRALAVVNEATVNVVADYLENGSVKEGSDADRVIETLKREGFFCAPYPERPIFPENYTFCPHEVTLFLTSRCNLNCRYCYADAGKKSIDMNFDVATAAIELVANNAGILGNEKFAVGFHGGGEVTMAWDLLVDCVDFSRKKADEKGLDVEIFACSNGLLSPKQRDFIIKNFTTMNISLDGPEDIQDYNRPTVKGKSSYKTVMETLNYFNQHNFTYGIRSTITAATVERMDEIVDFMADNFNLEYLQLEPVWFCGRCLTSGELPPSDQIFIENYLKAKKRAVERGINLLYSGARLDTLTSKFCAAPGDGFTVLPEGVVTSCFEVTELDDPRAELFHYGRYQADKHEFFFDQAKVERLQTYSVENIPYCQDCFCKWHCAGDCIAKVFEKSGSFRHEGSFRCELNRQLTLSALKDTIDQATQDTQNNIPE